MKPTLEEVKEYFENAEKIKDHSGDVGFPEPNKFIFTELGSGIVQNVDKENWLVLWEDQKGFAKILTTKEKTFSITAEQLMQLENGFTLPKLKEWFPEVFKVKLEVGKWMKTPNGGFYCPKEKLKNGFGCYGFSSERKTWLEKNVTEEEAINDVKATEQEVFEALKNEAEKRGFVEGGNMFEGMEDSTFLYKCKGVFEIIPQEELVDSMKGKTVMQLNRKDIFKNGKWATIIPTCTRAEAEKLLNKKIID